MNRAFLDKDPTAVMAMFDHVARRYDRTNTLLSGGQDRYWRRTVRAVLGLSPGQRVLDLAAGTAVSTVELAHSGAWCVGVDFSEKMLQAGRHRHVPKVVGDGLALPFRADTFDAVTISFGLRNTVDYFQTLIELARVTKPGGRLVVCEFSTPTNPIFSSIYTYYLTKILPAIAYRVSSNPQAYHYLAESICAWPNQTHLAHQISRAGWSNVGWCNLTGGIVALHWAIRHPHKSDGSQNGG